jgi:hypothetical protein
MQPFAHCASGKGGGQRGFFAKRQARYAEAWQLTKEGRAGSSP